MEEVKNKPTLQLDGAKFTIAEAEREVFMATMEVGTTRADVLDPAYFAHIAPRLRPYTEILLRCEDGTIYAKVLVLQAERTWARVHVLEWHDLTTKDVALSKDDVARIAKLTEEGATEFLVEFKGPTKLHCVIRKQDSAIVFEGIRTKAEAYERLAEHLKSTA